jgi:hypothetical protein
MICTKALSAADLADSKNTAWYIALTTTSEDEVVRNSAVEFAILLTIA